MQRDPLKEEDLLLSLKEGNLPAFEYLYKHYKYWMFLEAYMILKDDLAAQDLVQDLMIDFWENRLYADITTSLKGFLFKMVRNRALNYVRDHRRQEKKEAGFMRIHASTPATELDNTDINISLKKAIEKLPPKTHVVFTQFYLEGLSQKKIAELLNISPNTVNNHIENARKRIRKALKNLKKE